MHNTTAEKLHSYQDASRLPPGLFLAAENDMMDAVELAALIERMEQAKIRKAVTEAIKPYQRNGKDILYFCPSKQCYRIYIPKPLRKPANKKSSTK